MASCDGCPGALEKCWKRLGNGKLDGIFFGLKLEGKNLGIFPSNLYGDFIRQGWKMGTLGRFF